MAKRNWINTVRYKRAFDAGFEGVNKAGMAKRLMMGKTGAAQDQVALKKFYAAGKRAAAMVGAGAVTYDQAFAAADESIQRETVELTGEVLEAARAEQAGPAAEYDSAELAEEIEVDLAEADTGIEPDDAEIDDMPDTDMETTDDETEAGDIEDDFETTDDEGDLDEADQDEADIDIEASDEADADEADEDEADED